MIKKQVDFQYDKFFIGTGDKAISKEQVREEIKAMMKNGWEVFSTSTPGYDSQFGDVIYVITLVKYEYVDEEAKVGYASSDKSVAVSQDKAK